MKKKTASLRKTKKKKPLNLASIQATLSNAEKMCKELYLSNCMDDIPRKEELLGRKHKRIRRVKSVCISR
jgi:hypothetical protein